MRYVNSIIFSFGFLTGFIAFPKFFLGSKIYFNSYNFFLDDIEKMVMIWFIIFRINLEDYKRKVR